MNGDAVRRVLFEIRMTRGWLAYLLLTPCTWINWNAGFLWLLPFAGEWAYSDRAHSITQDEKER